MATVPISNVTRRTVYAPSGAGGVGPYAFTFEILANTDIAVYKDDTLLTLTTHYAVTINGNGTGSVLINATGLALAPVSPTQYAIVGNRTIARATDFTTGGDFFANTLNDELDQQTIFAQQNAEGLQRALQAPQTDPTTIDMTLPKAADRANKTLAFDAVGDPTLGISAADVANAVTYATNAANSATAAASSASAASSSASSASGSASTATTQATNASTSASSAATQASNASTSATNAATSASTATTQATNASTSASNASTSATNAAASASTATTQATNAASSATSANTAKVAAEAARDSALAAYDNFDDRYLGPYASNPTVDNDGNTLLAGALYFNTTAPEMRLWTGSAWVAAYVSGTGFVDLTSSQTIAGTKTFSSNPILSGGTANGVAYLNGSKVLTTGSALVFNGTNFSTTGTITVGSTDGTVTTGNGILNLVSTGGNDVVINVGSTRQTIFKAGGTEKARLNSYAAFVLAGGNTGSNGAGIAFPATQSASSDANTLDDYEEGTWTPGQQNFIISGTFSSAARYTRIGNIVHYSGWISATGSIAFSTSCLVNGFPYVGAVDMGFAVMRIEGNSAAQNSNNAGAQCNSDMVNSRIFFGVFTTTGANQKLYFAGAYFI